jgi:hypothetical protein
MYNVDTVSIGLRRERGKKKGIFFIWTDLSKLGPKGLTRRRPNYEMTADD